MGAAKKIDRPMTVEEFLAWDSEDDLTWELIDGYPRLKFPANPEFQGQAAPTTDHQRIVRNLLVVIDAKLRTNRPRCEVIPGTREAIPRRHRRCRVPDLAVRCGPDGSQPVLVVEVLSPSNTFAELAEREADYQSIPTVLEIVVVEQDRPVVHLRRRRGELWPGYRIEGIDQSVTLESVGLELPLTEMYRDVLPKGEADPTGLRA